MRAYGHQKPEAYWKKKQNILKLSDTGKQIVQFGAIIQNMAFFV